MPDNRKTVLALVQMRCDGPPADNLARAVRYIGEAADRGARLVVLPELFLGPYFCQRPDDSAAFHLAEPVPGPTAEALAQAARKHRIVLVGGSIFERGGDGRFYNTAIVLDETGRLLGTYRKTHIPEDILYHEQHYFAPGDTGVRVFDTSAGRVAPLICYDQWYPEAARIAALGGAEVIVYPTAIGVIDEAVEANITGDWEQMWRNAQLGHAAVNNVYVAAVNRVGREGHITFWGGSFVADPSGAVMAKAGAEDEIVMVECDLTRVPALQNAWRFLANRRPQAYGPLTTPAGSTLRPARPTAKSENM
jgi:N-carbamoylputrescine amidase